MDKLEWRMINQFPELRNSLIHVGDIIPFGNYFIENREEKKTIEWRVLAKEDDKILLISEYALDCQKYNSTYTDVTWETCSLRKWLNSTFLNNAFSTEEQAQIQSTKVTADKNPDYSTNPGNATTDKVFLLNITEVKKYFASDEDRKCIPTAYAIAQDVYTSSSYTKGGKATCWWWLRSPGEDESTAAYVDIDGSVDSSGGCVCHGSDGVRPALWIDLKSYRPPQLNGLEYDNHVSLIDSQLDGFISIDEIVDSILKKN